MTNQLNKKLPIEERSLESLLKSYKIRRKQAPHKYYIPNGKCEEFAKMVGSGKVFVSFFSAGNGLGKTALGCNILAHILFGNSGNKYFDNLPLIQNWPYHKRGRIISDPTTITQTLIPELKKWLPPGRYRTSKAGKNYEYNWQTDTGFKFDVMTLEQEAKEFESATLSFVWFDEPPTYTIFKATVARMRRGGIIFITATPLAGSSWLYDHVITYKGDKQGQRDFLYADISDNCIEHGVRGILKHSDIQKIINEYTEDEKQARIHGKFAHLTGLVFKNFNPKIHVIKPFTITKRDYMVVEALDTHPRNPDACLWLAKNRQGTMFIVDELYGSYKTGELARRIHKKAEEYRIELRLLEPAAFVEDQHRENPHDETLAMELANKYDLQYQKATKNRRRADRRIRDALDYEQVGDDILVAPELYIFDTCKRTIWEIEHLIWDDWRGKTAERKSPMEKPVDKDDHCLVGKTMIDLGNGQKAIKDLVGTEGIVKSINGVERYFNVRKTQSNVPVYRITFNNGKFVEATGEHLILSANNKWKELLHYEVGEKVFDIGQCVGYNGQYEDNNYILNKTRIQWREVLALWKVFWKEYEKQITSPFTQRSLAISQWKNSQRLCYSSQGQQSGQQPDREFAFNKKRRTRKLSYDTRKERAGKGKYVKQCYPGGSKVAQIARSKMALRQIKEKTNRSKEASYLQTYLRILWQGLSFFKKTKINVLFQKLQRQGIMACQERTAKIKEIKYIGLRDVYNMEVKNTHCFSVCGGIIVHNCIEDLGRILVQEMPFIEMTRANKEYTGIRSGKDFDPYD